MMVFSNIWHRFDEGIEVERKKSLMPMVMPERHLIGIQREPGR